MATYLFNQQNGQSGADATLKKSIGPKEEFADCLEIHARAFCPLYAATKDFFTGIDAKPSASADETAKNNNKYR